MEPSRETHYTLVDLLDRVLDKGVVLYADIIISVAGVPLIGVNLRAALAGVETMLSYGVMTDWRQEADAEKANLFDRCELPLISREHLRLEQKVR